MRQVCRVHLRALCLWAGCFGSMALPIATQAQVTVDPALPDYQAVPGVSGTVKSVGSDTMNNLMTLWLEGFRRFYPNVRPEIEGKGSSTAMPALISGAASFGPMSRPVKASESDEFEKRFGYKPTQLVTSIDLLAVFVNNNSPLKSLTMPQVDAIFSKQRKLGAPVDLRTWGQLGLSGAWASAPISAYGRNAASGTYGYFKEHALGKGDFKDSVKEQPGSSAVVQAVGRDRYGIGYSGVGYVTPQVRPLPLAADDESEPVPPEKDHAYSGDYPLARGLLLVLSQPPGKELDPLRREFVRYVFSKQGQQDVIKDGYLPVTAEMAQETLRMLSLDKTSSDKP